MRRAVFFDRDGVANVPPPDERRYVLHPDQLEVYPAFVEAMRVVAEAGWPAVLVTNQKCVGRGLITAEVLAAIHAKLVGVLAEEGLAFLEMFACTATDDAHPDRKPNPGMLVRAAEAHGLDLAASWMVGDNDSDVFAGQAAGCRTIKVGAPGTSSPDEWVKGIGELPALLRGVLDS